MLIIKSTLKASSHIHLTRTSCISRRIFSIFLVYSQAFKQTLQIILTCKFQISITAKEFRVKWVKWQYMSSCWISNWMVNRVHSKYRLKERVVINWRLRSKRGGRLDWHNWIKITVSWNRFRLPNWIKTALLPLPSNSKIIPFPAPLSKSIQF